MEEIVILLFSCPILISVTIHEQTWYKATVYSIKIQTITEENDELEEENE